jgi:hypothetical protein
VPILPESSRTEEFSFQRRDASGPDVRTHFPQRPGLLHLAMAVEYGPWNHFARASLRLDAGSLLRHVARIPPSSFAGAWIIFPTRSEGVTPRDRTPEAHLTMLILSSLEVEIGTAKTVELMPTILVPLVPYLHTQLGHCTGLSFIDSTSLAVCRNPRIHQHRVFAGRAARQDLGRVVLWLQAAPGRQ